MRISLDSHYHRAGNNIECMKRIIYAPVADFERATSYCPRKAAPRCRPLYLAWRILDDPSSQCFDAIKARDYFRTPIPEAFADKLARRAEAVFAHHPSWSRKATPRDGQRQFQSQRQHEFILMSMRHWLAGVLARERPALFRDLPESFKVGHPLPLKPHPWRKRASHPGPAHSLTRKSFPSSGSATFSHPMGEGHLPSDRRGISKRENHRPRFLHGSQLLAVC